MRDVQNEKAPHEMPINKVGIKGLRYPITVRDRHNGVQQTIASLTMSVELPMDFKGTHMSRFLEVLHENQRVIDIRQCGAIMEEVMRRLSAPVAHFDFTFPYFIEKEAPVSRVRSLMDYDCFYRGSINRSDGQDFSMGVVVPVTSLCPCSKEISEFGAHNQRSYVTIEVRFAPGAFVWLEDLISIAEEAASSAVYGILKRPDEKFVTEFAYRNPRFVEDIVREVASRLLQRNEVSWLKVESENLESIHNHNAFAMIEIDKNRPTLTREACDVK